MPKSVAKDWAICVATNNDVGYAKVLGRAIHHVSVPLKEFANSIFQNKRTLIIDLDDITCIDSTFMGILVGIQDEYETIPDQEMVLINVSIKVGECMRQMGLHFVLKWFSPGQTPEEYSELTTQIPSCENLSKIQPDVADIAKHMLEAHEKLSNVTPENGLRFKDVIEYLRDDLKNHQKNNEA